MDAALLEAIAIVGTKAELGRRIGVTGQAVGQWARVPPRRVIAVEAATGGRVSRHRLRPDIYPEDDRKVA